MNTHPLFQYAEETALTIRTDCTLAMVPSSGLPTLYVPLIWVEVAQRPDVSDLWMVHERYGEGDQRCQWLYAFNHEVPEQTVFYLSCEIVVPSIPPVTFVIAFSLSTQAELVERITASPLLGIMTEPFPVWKEHQKENEPLILTPEMLPVIRKGIMLEVGHPELLEMLHVWHTLLREQKAERSGPS